MINVTNIERFATHDGPGIRTTVFLKGCPLHCPWCANPETQSGHPELLWQDRCCVHCCQCIATCPNNALQFNADGQLLHDTSLCQYCYRCEDTCLHQAITFSGKAMEVSAVMEELRKDKDYYDMSDGGVTFSGGEPFVQTEGLRELLRLSKAAGLHTAVETTGNYTREQLQDCMANIDLFLYDFKHSDNRLLKEVTGGNGTLIKENLMYLLRKDASRVIVRMPVIPGFHTLPEDLHTALRYLHEIGVQRVHLLPYHSLGKAKYEQMGKRYTMPTQMMDKKELEPYQVFGEALGMQVQIGG